MEQEPDFYLWSSDPVLPRKFNAPLKCFRLKKIQSNQGLELLLVRIDPPLTLDTDQLLKISSAMLILSPRHEGGSFFPINEWPMYVYVYFAPKHMAEIETFVNSGEISKSFHWGELYEK
jgi:hypothetical protein